MKYYNKIIHSAIFFISISFTIVNGQTNHKLQPKELDKNNKLELTGLIPGLMDGETVSLYEFSYPVKEDSWKLVDSESVKNGKFYFQYHVTDGPRLFRFDFSKHGHVIVIPFANEKVFISSSKNINDISPNLITNIFEYIKFDGSQIANDHLYLTGLLRTWYYSTSYINGAIRRFTDSTKSKENLRHIVGLLQAKELLNKGAAETLVSPPVRKLIPYFFSDLPFQMQRESLFVDIYKRLDEETKNSYYGKIMHELIPLCIGQSALDFNYSTPEEKFVSLSEVVKKNKLTILHFWSSRSIDRKRIHKEILDLFQKYHKQGLDVVSISLDANPNKWKQALQEDKIPGYQICDFKEEESIAAQLYKMVPKNTVNVLIDGNGKILGWDIDGAKLFGYVYRIFGE